MVSFGVISQKVNPKNDAFYLYLAVYPKSAGLTQ